MQFFSLGVKGLKPNSQINGPNVRYKHEANIEGVQQYLLMPKIILSPEQLAC